MASTVGIKAISVFTPSTFESIDSIAEQSGLSRSLLEERLGLTKKPVLPLTSSLISMAEHAVDDVLKKSNVKGSSIKVLVYCSMRPHEFEYWSPAAHLIKRIGAQEAFGFELSNGCNSGNIGLNVVAQYLKNDSQLEYGLVVVNDALSRGVNYKKSADLPIFNWSDGASAILLCRNSKSFQILAHYAETNPTLVNFSKTPPGERFIKFSDDILDEECLKTSYKKTYPKVIFKALAKARLETKHIDHLFMNQGDHRLISFICDQLSIDSTKVKRTHDNYGHLNGSDIFLGLNKAMNENKIKDGQVLVLASSALGFTWGCTIIRA